MSNNSLRPAKNNLSSRSCGEEGTAILIALFVMILLMGFVVLAISRTSNETVASANDVAETRSFEAAQASLEVMTHNFDKIFDVKINPDNNDLHGPNGIENKIPVDFGADYDFAQTITPTGVSEIVVMTGQQFQGLNAQRDEWQLDTTATDKISGVKVRLQRKFFNNRIPIFQFGIFYEDDLEFHPGPRFDFGGRVHSNRHLFMKANDLFFSSKVTTVGEVFTDVMRNGDSTGGYTNSIRIKNASGSNVSLNADMGSVLKDVVNGSPKINAPDFPVAYTNSNWASNEALFQGNLLANQSRLDLPLKIASQLNGNALDYIELIKRGKAIGDLYSDNTGTLRPVLAASADSVVTSQERYYNKPGIRVSIADSKAKLPGCASGIGTNAILTVCGIRLDGDAIGQGAYLAGSRGYQPKPMSDGYQATKINGERILRSGAQTWIKIETVTFDTSTNSVVAKDITEDILSLGVTEPAPSISVSGSTKFAISASSYYTNNIDKRSVIKLQRFVIDDGRVETADTNFLSAATWNGKDYNFVVASADTNADNGTYGSFSGDSDGNKKAAVINGYANAKIVPFPIEMFDTREGLYNDDINTGTIYGNNLPWAGVMSMIDIDVANLKKFLRGDYDSDMPIGTDYYAKNAGKLTAGVIPESDGWVVYISDRRGDGDFDGEYDMEDIYGPNDNIKQYGEDINDDGILQKDYNNEAVKYRDDGSGDPETVARGIAATIDHKYYRRGVRLINGIKLPGIYDAATPANTKGFTVASENGVYVLGNYNAEGINSTGTPTPASNYRPQNTDEHIPASVVADAVTILSNAWTDGNGFENPFNKGNRQASETTVRFAMMAGDARSSLRVTGEPNQGGGDIRLTGGVHNFKRFLENWNARMNYSGSLINLYNSRNNNAAFKCCVKVYGAPTRNWVFDTSFLDPNRLPPGTPFFQTIQLTGFERLN